MGTCCFTPRKTEVLWWYWLLLFSIVGIPMLLATLYVAKRIPRENYSRRHARIAAAIFWGASLLSLLLTILTLTVLGAEHLQFFSFLLSFIFCMFITTAACEAVEKRSGASRRIPFLLLYLVVWFLVAVFPGKVWAGGGFGIYGNEGSLATIVMEFAALNDSRSFLASVFAFTRQTPRLALRLWFPRWSALFWAGARLRKPCQSIFL